MKKNHFSFPGRLAVLGSTGSVGRQALAVAAEQGIAIDLLAARRSVPLLEEQIRAFSPRFCAVTDPAAAADLAVRVRDTGTRVLSGEDGLLAAIAQTDAAAAVNAILGKDGLAPTLAVLRRGMRLALSNKESLVIAGEIVKKTARENRAELLPVDSEHCAIFQCLLAGHPGEIRRILLTASGGPFFGRHKEELERVTKAETLAHPTWQMGEKITVDSATLMNKGFELIEAVHLFDVSPADVTVLVHRESIIHSAVEYIDNTVIAQLSVPDMRSCVQYALSYPGRAPAVIPSLDLAKLATLSFAVPDEEAFPLLPLSRRAILQGGAAPAILNAADEVAVGAFLREEISFAGISRTVEETYEATADLFAERSLEGILAADAAAREKTRELITAKRRV